MGKNSETKKNEKVSAVVDGAKTVVKVPAKVVKIIAVVVVLVLLIVGGYAIISGVFSDDGSKLTTACKSTLDKAVGMSDLSTVDYTYNAVAKATEKDDNGKTIVKYHIAYDGKVKAGIDFKKVEISIDEDKKKIIAKLPEVKIQTVSVDVGSLEYIFADDDYNTENISEEAYKICKKDLKTRADKEENLLKMAKDNAKSTVKGLLSPWVSQFDDYSVEVK